MWLRRGRKAEGSVRGGLKYSLGNARMRFEKVIALVSRFRSSYLPNLYHMHEL
jgi:hypothetical protein